MCMRSKETVGRYMSNGHAVAWRHGGKDQHNICLARGWGRRSEWGQGGGVTFLRSEIQTASEIRWLKARDGRATSGPVCLFALTLPSGTTASRTRSLSLIFFPIHLFKFSDWKNIGICIPNERWSLWSCWCIVMKSGCLLPSPRSTGSSSGFLSRVEPRVYAWAMISGWNEGGGGMPWSVITYPKLRGARTHSQPWQAS